MFLLNRSNIAVVRYHAEHYFGHLYAALGPTVLRFIQLDPCNCFNPGIRGTSKLLRWKGKVAALAIEGEPYT